MVGAYVKNCEKCLLDSS